MKRAYEYANKDLRDKVTNGLIFNGTTDANLLVTPGEHATHDLGMAMDIGFSDTYIARAFQRVHDERTISINAPDLPESARLNQWSTLNAVDLVAKLTSDKPTDSTVQDEPGNYKQSAALSQFLALYSLTQKTSGDWSNIVLANNDAANKVRSALFGSGDSSGSIIQGVYIGRDDAKDKSGKVTQKFNGYDAIRQVLTALGVTNKKLDPHETHFHVYFKPPKLQPIELTHALTAQTAPVKSKAPDAKFGVCDMLDGDSPENGGANISVGRIYDLLVDAGQKPTEAAWGAAKVEVIKQPKHGAMTLVSGKTVEYLPTEGWQKLLNKNGDLYDSGTVRLTVGARQYQVKVNVVLGGGYTPDLREIVCPRLVWRISGEISEESPAQALSIVDPQTMLGQVVSGLAQSGIEFQQLIEGRLGEVTSLTAPMLLSIDAAGHGWYLDPTPLDNTDDFLPTPDKTIWRAKFGSAADGRMDMLSVLLHEYGHVLGLEHSGDASDFMAATLQPGERRLPTEAELEFGVRSQI